MAPIIEIEAPEAEEWSETNTHEVRAWAIEPADQGRRLDQALAAGVPEFSRSHLQSLIALGVVHVDGAAARTASMRVRVGQHIQVQLIPTAQSQAFKPEPMALDVVFEDTSVLVLNKPAGLVVHPAAGHWQGTLMNGVLAHHAPAIDLPRAGIVHRLDKDTSGVMVVAKTLSAMTALTRALAARSVHRQYVALVHGWPMEDAFSVHAGITRDPRTRTRMMAVPANTSVGSAVKPARTDVRVLKRATVDGQAFTAVACTLHSGRTHQIRVHLSHVGHPVVGDATYGGTPALAFDRQALHAEHLAFAHPVSGEALHHVAPYPSDFVQGMRRLAVH
jgi:23S rRNA pseudouridine1911/1915/1917 synthase